MNTKTTDKNTPALNSKLDKEQLLIIVIFVLGTLFTVLSATGAGKNLIKKRTPGTKIEKVVTPDNAHAMKRAATAQYLARQFAKQK